MAWIADVVPEEPISSTAWGNLVRDRVVQVFDSDADRNANAHPRDGMMAWSIAEGSLAVWSMSTVGMFDGWTVVVENYRPFTPRLWVGAVEYGINTLTSSGYRRLFGACQFYVSARWGILPGDQTGDIVLLPPMQPKDDTNGGFGTMYVTPMDAAAPEVGFGLFNGTITQPGAPYPGQLAIGSPKDGRLLNGADLTAAESGLFYCYASGQFPLAVPTTI